MPVATTTAQPQKNIWVAAGEGDLDRVKELIENESLSPNTPDPYSYTPMHAAASYNHIHVLEYLVSRGGDVNVKDDDGETPLFTVESIDMARWLVENGAGIAYQNTEGNNPARHLSEDFPHISAYLQTLDPSVGPLPPASLPQPSNYATDHAASQLTQSLLNDAENIIQRAEAENRDPEAELREMVGRAVLGGVVTGAALAQSGIEDGAEEDRRDIGHESKRPRFDQDGR